MTVLQIRPAAYAPAQSRLRYATHLYPANADGSVANTIAIATTASVSIRVFAPICRAPVASTTESLNVGSIRRSKTIITRLAATRRGASPPTSPSCRSCWEWASTPPGTGARRADFWASLVTYIGRTSTSVCSRTAVGAVTATGPASSIAIATGRRWRTSSSRWRLTELREKVHALCCRWTTT
jgi:hypothetical protein